MRLGRVREPTWSWQSALIAGILLLAGLVFLVVGTKIWVDGRRFLATALPASGEVIRIVEHYDASARAGDEWSYYPMLRFVPSGEEQPVVFESDEAVDPRKVRVGDHVPILYDPANPGNAHMDNAMTRWGWTAILLSMGLIFVIPNAAILYVQMRRLRRQRSTPRRA
jgi:hypothetical protein